MLGAPFVANIVTIEPIQVFSNRSLGKLWIFLQPTRTRGSGEPRSSTPRCHALASRTPRHPQRHRDDQRSDAFSEVPSSRFESHIASSCASLLSSKAWCKSPVDPMRAELLEHPALGSFMHAIRHGQKVPQLVRPCGQVSFERLQSTCLGP